MIIVTVTGRIKPEFRTAFLQHMADLTPIVQREEGCIVYQQNISAADENILFLYEEWESREKWLAHMSSPHMVAHLEEARPWFDDVDMKTLDATPFTLDESN